jgi:carbohydrate-binding DOMON domain-containing protein
VRNVRARSQDNRKLLVESAAFGLGYTAVLIWSGAALVASFSGGEAEPYWPAIPHLRTETAGVIAFAVAAISLVVSRYLQLRRRSGAPAQPATRSADVLAVQAVAETAAVLSTGLVVYLSLNAVTHPVTLGLQLTHLWPCRARARSG